MRSLGVIALAIAALVIPSAASPFVEVVEDAGATSAFVDLGAWSKSQELLAAGESVVVSSKSTVTDADGTIHTQTMIGTERSQTTSSVSALTGIAASKLGRCGIAKVSLLEEGPWPLYVNLYRYSMERGRCWKDGKLTSVYRLKRWNEYAVSEYAWYFCCHVEFAKTTGTTTAWSFTQGKYEQCLLSKGCFRSKTPWLELIVRGNGTVTRDKDGG